MNIHKHRITEIECNKDYELRMGPFFSLLQESIEDDVEVSMFDHKAMQANGNLFVLTQMLVDMKHMPKVKDNIKIKTWPAGLDKLYALRKYEIYDEKDNLIGSVDSVWVIIDLATRLPLRLNKAYPQYKWGGPEFPVPARIKASKDFIKIDEIITKYSDIDANNHVNNSKYIAWVEDAIGYTPLKLAANYINETKLNDKIEVFKSDKQVAFKKDDKIVFIAEVE